MTIDGDNFGSMFSISTEKWWEYYWKFDMILYSSDNLAFITSSLDFYFIQFKSRRHQPRS